MLTLLYTENPGAFLSLGSKFPVNVRHLVFDGFVSIGLLVAAFALFTARMGLGGDALAHRIHHRRRRWQSDDRLRFGGLVTDFIYLAVGPLQTACSTSPTWPSPAA